MQKKLLDFIDPLKSGQILDRQDADYIINLQEDQLHTLMFLATEIRRHFYGSGVKTCSIINAKSGRCRED